MSDSSLPKARHLLPVAEPPVLAVDVAAQRPVEPDVEQARLVAVRRAVHRVAVGLHPIPILPR
jgi:hypothetical protein